MFRLLRVQVEQFHPEYAAGQLEVSVAPADPVAAADDAVLVRHTVRSRSLAHGWRASFAPSVDPVGGGSGVHLRLSVHDADGSLMSGGEGPFGLRSAGESLANPYLLIGAVLAAGLSGVIAELRLPAAVEGDPAGGGGSVRRLPTSAGEAAAALESSFVLAAVLGPRLHDAILAVRRAEAERCSSLDPMALPSAVRWRW